jgi:hypothetical protein
VDDHHHGYSAACSRAAYLDVHQYRVADQRECLRIHAKVAEDASHVGDPVPNAFMAAVGLGNVREFREVVELGIWMPGSDPLVVITTV